MQGLVRTLKVALESRLQIQIDESHDSLPWLIRDVSWLKNRFAVKHVGRIAYARWKGKSFRKEVVEFGEQAMYLKPGSRGK